MIIRKYLVDNINEALFRIKQELGDDAYIINQKMVKQPGIKGFFMNKKIEVTVGLGNKNSLPNNNVYEATNMLGQGSNESQVSFQNLQSNNLKQNFSNSYGQNLYSKNTNSDSMSYYNKLFQEKQRMFKDNFENNDDMSIRLASLNGPNFDLANKTITSDSGITRDLNMHNERAGSLNNKDSVNGDYDIKKGIEEIKEVLNKFLVKPQKSPNYMDIFLEKHNICKELGDEIKSKCLLTNDELMNENVVSNYLRNVFSNVIETYEKDDFGKIIVVGPTGCGKTTTVAKLAGMFSLTLNKKVGLVNTDTVRIGAVEQLKMYADIMDMPYKYVMNLSDIKNIDNDMKDCETVIIDTVGRGHRNIIQLSELNMFIQSMKCDDISLVVNAGIRDRDLENFMNSFKDIKFTNAIVTKLDETDSLGTLINICYKTLLPISFITTGQEVPVDIRKANKGEILDMIFGEEKLKIHG